MGKVTGDDIHYRLEEINSIIGKQYALEHPQEERDWKNYEKEFSDRIKTAMMELEPLVSEAVSAMHRAPGPGHPHTLSLEQRVRVLLIKQLVGKSNRMFANMLVIFSMVSGIDVSYKTIERLYSDDGVILAVHNLHVLILSEKGVNNSNATGDGTGYGLTVKKNYESYAQKLKDLAKESPENRKEKDMKADSHKKRIFAYSFNIMDLETGLYIAMGASMKSERQAYDRAIGMLGSIHIEMASIRLDRYYSFPSYMDKLGNTKVYIMPKKNSTLNGSKKWKDAMREFVENTVPYLEEYHQRSNSESGFAADKKMLGWNVAQKRSDRIYSALFCTGTWHNLLNMGRL
jgi:transposase